MLFFSRIPASDYPVNADSQLGQGQRAPHRPARTPAAQKIAPVPNNKVEQMHGPALDHLRCPIPPNKPRAAYTFIRTQIPPLFSAGYELLFPQPLYFQHFLRCPIVFPKSINPHPPAPSPLSVVFTPIFALNRLSTAFTHFERDGRVGLFPVARLRCPLAPHHAPPLAFPNRASIISRGHHADSRETPWR